jgi:hypothetical protein
MSQSQSNIEPQFSSAQAEQATPLLTVLPYDIREKIYAEILPAHRILHPRVNALFKKASDHESGKKRFRKPEIVLALARTCQAFYTELIPFYYRSKTLSFHCAYDLYRYLYMIGPHRRQLVQKINFFLVGGTLGWGSRTTKTQEVYEWACEMLRECVSLKKLGIGISVETKDGMEEGPLKGLDVLSGMGLKDLELRVREIWLAWPHPVYGHAGFESVWEIPLTFQPGQFGCGVDPRYFKPEVVLALEKRLLRDMQSDKVGGYEVEIETEFHKVADDSKSTPKRGERKRGAQDVPANGRKRTRQGQVKKAGSTR